MNKNHFIDEYLKGKHPIEGESWELPTEGELERDEALYDALLAERTAPFRLPRWGEKKSLPSGKFGGGRWLLGIAASILLLLMFRFSQEPVEEQPVLPFGQAQAEVAETIEQSTPQPAVSEPIVEEKEEEALPKVQPTLQSAKKRRKAVKEQCIPIDEPMLAKAEPTPQGTAVSPETEQNVAQYHILRTIQITPNQSVYIIETSGRPEMEAIASMSELRARGQRLTANIEQHHQASIVF